MVQTAIEAMSEQAFFAWQERQDDRHELVRGYPVRMRAGATNLHDLLVVNLIAALHLKLRRTGFAVFTGAGSVRIRLGLIRRPDVGVDRGPRDPTSYKASTPVIVGEVLSPISRDVETLEKLCEYQALDSLDYILFVEPNTPEATLWRRADDRRWKRDLIEGVDGRIAMPSIGVDLALVDLYDGITFPPSPRLI